MGIFKVCSFFACTVCSLPILRPWLWLLLAMQHRESWQLWFSKPQSWIQEWDNIIFSDESLFCVRYAAVYVPGGSKETTHSLLSFDINMVALGAMVWAAIGCTGHLHLYLGLMVIWTQICTYLTFYVQWLCLILEACQTQSSNKILQDKIG